MGIELTDEKLKQAFAQFDKDGSGSIQSSEFLDLMKALEVHITPFEAKLLFNLCDTDANGKLSFTEFKEMWEKQDEWTPEDHLRAMFRTADVDGSGCLSKDELEDLLINGKQLLGGNIEDDEVERLMNKLDIDGNGRAFLCVYFICTR